MARVRHFWAAKGATALAALALVGCGSSAAGPSPSTATSGSATATAKQLFPNGLTLLVGFGPGGGVDLSARLVQPYLQKALGVTVTVQNDAGAAGNLAASQLYQDGPNAATIMPAFLPSLPMEQLLNHGHFTASKFTALWGMYGNEDDVIFTSKHSAYKTLANLQNSPRTITAAVSGIDNAPWLELAELAIENHVKLQVVPFNSGAQAADAVLGGTVDIGSDSNTAAARALNTGKARAIVQFGPTRNAQFPNTPTIAQAGGTSKEAYVDEIGFFGPPKMNSAAVQVLDAAFAQVAKNPAFITKAKADGLIVESVPHAAFQQHLAHAYQQIATLLPSLEKFSTSKKAK